MESRLARATTLDVWPSRVLMQAAKSEVVVVVVGVVVVGVVKVVGGVVVLKTAGS